MTVSVSSKDVPSHVAFARQMQLCMCELVHSVMLGLRCSYAYLMLASKASATCPKLVFPPLRRVSTSTI